MTYISEENNRSMEVKRRNNGYKNNSKSINRNSNKQKRKLRIIRNIIIGVCCIVVCTLLTGIYKNVSNNDNAVAVSTQINEGTKTDVTEKTKKSQYRAVKDYKIKAPKDYTRDEMTDILKEYAKTDEDIRTIYENIDDYDSDMLDKVVNNPEMALFIRNCLDYSDDEIIPADLSGKEKGKQNPLFLQWDERWGHIPYGDSNIGLAGCGPTCVAMAVFSLTRNEDVTPKSVAEYSEQNGHYVEGIGTAWSLMTSFPKSYNISVSEVSLSEESLINELNAGHQMICAMGPGDFTRGGHFILIYGYDEKGFKINDPNCIARSKKRWSYDRLKTQIRAIWGFSK